MRMCALWTGLIALVLFPAAVFGEEWHPLPKTLPRFSECTRAEREGGSATRTFSERFISTQTHCVSYRRVEIGFSDLAYPPGARPAYAGGEYVIGMLRYRVMPRSQRESGELMVCGWKPEKLYWRMVQADGKPSVRQFALVRVRSYRTLWLFRRWQWKELVRGAIPFAEESKELQEILSGIAR